MSSGIVICRLCAESKHKSKQVDLVCAMLMRDKVILRLERLNSFVDFNDNKLPNTVCLDCIRILDKCCDFVETVKNTQNVLHDLFYKRIVTRKDIPNDVIFFERSGLDDCHFLSESESDASIESQDAATPSTDDDLTSADLIIIHNPEITISSVGSDKPLAAVVPPDPKSVTQAPHSVKFSLGNLKVNNSDSSARTREPLEVKAGSDGIMSRHRRRLKKSRPSVIMKHEAETIAIMSLESSPCSTRESSVCSIISISDSDDIIHEQGLGSNKPDTIVEFDKPIEVIPPKNEAQSNDITLKASKSNNLDSSVESGKKQEKETKKKSSLTNVESNKPKVISLYNKAQSDNISSKPSISNKLDPVLKSSETEEKKTKKKTLDKESASHPRDKSGEPKEKKPKKKTPPVKQSVSLDPNSPAEEIKAWENYNWLCTFCETIFPTIDELCSHSMEVHSSCNPYRCTQCKLRHRRLSTFMEHITLHMTQLRLTCFKCPAKFANMDKAKKHIKVHFQKLSCSGCHTTFKNSKELQTHQDAYLQTKYSKKVKNPLIAHDGFTCKVCSKTYTNKTRLGKHVLSHKGRKREYVCEICGDDYFEKNHLTYHMGTHADDQPLVCKICNLCLKKRNVLKEHVWDNDKQFPCDTCDKTFKLEKHLKRHKAVHDDKLRFECSDCQKCFRIKGTLIRHIRKHTGEKPFLCKLCKEIFRNRSNFTRHMWFTHNMNISKVETEPVLTKDTKKWKTEMMERKLS